MTTRNGAPPVPGTITLLQRGLPLLHRPEHHRISSFERSGIVARRTVAAAAGVVAAAHRPRRTGAICAVSSPACAMTASIHQNPWAAPG